MLRRSLVVIPALCGVIGATSAVSPWEYADKSFSGSYAIYVGSPSQQEARAPVAGDAKVAFSVRGAVAKEIFDAIGAGPAERAPAERTCLGHADIRVRERDALICRHAAKDGYWCTFGFDLSTGLSTWGIVSGRICNE